jgi:hypothetical protein
MEKHDNKDNKKGKKNIQITIDDDEFASLNSDSLHLYSLNYQNSVVIHKDE